MRPGIRAAFLALLTVLLLAISVAPVWAAQSTPEGTPVPEGTPLPDDAATQDDGGSADTLGGIIGALGLFAAMMAVLALGTEVTIDTLKFFVGLKRKPAALEALDQLGNKLPGQLRELGADSRAIAQLEDLTEDMRAALAPLKQPVQITWAVRNGDFKTAIDLAEQLAAQVGRDPVALRADFVEALGSGVQALGSKLALDPALTGQLRAGLVNAAQAFDASNAAVQALAWLQTQAPQISDAWLRGNAQVIAEQGLERGRAALLQRFDEQARPQLEGLGLDAAAVNTIRSQLEQGLERLTGHLHLDAMTQLLEGVELRRFQIQSPLRKLWRRLRDSKFPSELHPALSSVRMGKLLESLERLWNYLLGRTPEAGDLGAPRPVEPLTPTSVARRLLELDSFHRDEEASRLRVLRMISVVVGTWLAYVLHVDSVVLLSNAFDVSAINSGFGDLMDQLSIVLPPDLTAGILLSGLAASAGSAFWHDQLERLQIAKKAATQVQKVVETVRGAQAE